MEKKLKHLEMIQGVINRMAHTSFLLKGWSVILVSGLFALAAKDAKAVFVIVACFPAIAFWVLDGFYLWQERLYRALYDKVRKADESEIDFSMSTAEVGKTVAPWCCVLVSKTMLLFHGTIIATIAIVMVVALKQVPGGSP